MQKFWAVPAGLALGVVIVATAFGQQNEALVPQSVAATLLNTWTTHSIPAGINWSGRVAYAPEIRTALALGGIGSGQKTISSADGGNTWTQYATVNDVYAYNAAAWLPWVGQFAALGFHAGSTPPTVAMTSPDAKGDWTPHTPPIVTDSWGEMATSNILRIACAVSYDGSFTSTTDGQTWTAAMLVDPSRPVGPASPGTFLRRLVRAEPIGLFVAIDAGNGQVYTSPNCATPWTRAGIANQSNGLTFVPTLGAGQGMIVSSGPSGTVGTPVMTSIDGGLTWQSQTPAGSSNIVWAGAGFSNALGAIVIGGHNPVSPNTNAIQISFDGIHFSLVNAPANTTNWAGFTELPEFGTVVAMPGNSAVYAISSAPIGFSAPAAPTVTSISPSMGSVFGGDSVMILGSGFTGATGVTIGGGLATNVVVMSDSLITATTPTGVPGPAAVIVATPNGINSTTSTFTYGLGREIQMYSLEPLNFQVVQNESLIASGATPLSADQGGAVWQATTTTPWLTLNASAGSFPGTMTMTANAASLAVGTYNGTITVTSGISTLAVPVTLTVLAPLSVTANPGSIFFASGFPATGAGGYDIQVGPAGAAFTAQTSASSNGWLSLSMTSGVAPATIHVTIDPSHSIQGAYRDSIVITSPGSPNGSVSVPVTMEVASLIPSLPQQVNTATGAGPDHTVAPNEMVSLSLSDFSCDSQPVVALNGTPVLWSSYTAGQINYAVPATVTQGSSVSVSCDGTAAWSYNGLNVAADIPGIMTLPGVAAGQAAAMNANAITNGAAGAASRGSSVSVFVTGFGAFGPVSQDGLRLLAGTVTAQIGGVPATVEYAGEAPGGTDGIQQVNLTVPLTAPVGNNVPLMLWVNGVPTQSTATIAVQ